ncbi:hypothetical protein [Microbispora hainanensis]|uniref:Transposase n=1 Tax=Microbispora hainanensis TaxID=568844 RepID=A0ABZ1SR42_9ACTN|nr:hypothetical protein [Microbispora hainanensis]
MKSEHRPYRLDGGAIRIGGDTYGIAAEIDDPEGWVWAALQLMDGSRDPDAIATLLSDRFGSDGLGLYRGCRCRHTGRTQ